MNTDNFRDQLIERALKNLSDLDSRPPAARFTHAFTPQNVSEILAALAKFQCIPLFSDFLLFGVADSPNEVPVILAEHSDGALIWLPTACLRLLQALSSSRSAPIHWISVFEDYRQRAYLLFENGAVTNKLLDSEPLWLTNKFTGDDILGRGSRQFESLTNFKSAIAKYYVPKDEQWDFELLHEQNLPNLYRYTWAAKTASSS